MSTVNRKSGATRPAWVYSDKHNDREWSWMQLEMLESVRNVMEEVRAELKRINSTLQCSQFQAIPSTLRRISRNTAKPRKKKEM